SSTCRLRPKSVITWQDRQKAVDWARSICAEKPAHIARAGRINKATKARIFPSRDRVRRARNPTIKARIPATATNRAVTEAGTRFRLGLGETAIVVHERCDLIFRELLAVAVHIGALAGFDDLDHLGGRHLADG